MNTITRTNDPAGYDVLDGDGNVIGWRAHAHDAELLARPMSKETQARCFMASQPWAVVAWDCPGWIASGVNAVRAFMRK